MTKMDRAKELHTRQKLGLSLQTVYGRVQAGWSDEKILKTPWSRAHPVAMDHPYKRPMFEKVRQEKLERIHKRKARA